MNDRVLRALELDELVLVRSTSPLSRGIQVPVVAHQRVHPVDRDELLGELEARVVMLLRRAHDPAEDLRVAEAAEAVLERLAEDARPVDVHREPQRRAC